jgi:Domain of unknown function (DUF4258)
MKKNKGLVNIVVIILLGITAFFINRNRKLNPNNKRNQQQEAFRKIQNNHFRSDKNVDNTSKIDPAELNRHPKNLHYSKHAKCRMNCRNLDESEVQEILNTGKINFAKSNDRPNKCPTYALEGRTHDGQQSRMVFSFCGAEDVTVVTVIDLDTDWECNCY